MSVSGLIDDIYRGQAYPGGVANFGFPLLWTAGIRNAYDILGGQAQPLIRSDPSDPKQEAIREQCLKNIATHSRTIGQDPILQGVTSQTDNDWYRVRSLITYVDRINVPIHITGAYQDEQTGPRGPAHLWEKIRGVPKRLVLANGDHDTNNPCCGPRELVYDRLAWMDHWMRGDDTVADSLGITAALSKMTSGRVLFEVNDKNGKMITNESRDFSTFRLKTRGGAVGISAQTEGSIRAARLPARERTCTSRGPSAKPGTSSSPTSVICERHIRLGRR
jgi:predicted acyl esterase